MRKILFKLLPIITAVVISSCDKLEDFGSTNNNQNATPNPIPAALLTNSLSQVGGYVTLTRQALYCQYFSETQYTDVSLYSLPKLTSTGNYSGILMDLQYIININSDPATASFASKSGSNNSQIAIARILKSFIYWYITDSWGDVPYSEALKGEPNVAYDSQQSIYEGMLTELTEAVAQFDAGPLVKGDIVYAGDVAKWKKFANSMRMLMALRLSERFPAAGGYAATQFAAALASAAGSIDNNADNFVLTYVGGNFKNPFYAMYDGRKDFALSVPMIANLPSGDTRLGVFGSSNVGMPYGLDRTSSEAFTAANPTWARIMEETWRAQTSPIFVITAGEVLLARAEAAQLGWTSESAQTMFQNGITAAFGQWGLAVPGAYDVTVSNIAEIHLQQYVAAYPNGWFGWANWRRTDVPVLVPAPDYVSPTAEIPRRYLYGDAEEQLTKAGVKAAKDVVGTSYSQTSHVWWDAN